MRTFAAFFLPFGLLAVGDFFLPAAFDPGAAFFFRTVLFGLAALFFFRDVPFELAATFFGAADFGFGEDALAFDLLAAPTLLRAFVAGAGFFFEVFAFVINTLGVEFRFVIFTKRKILIVNLGVGREVVE